MYVQSILAFYRYLFTNPFPSNSARILVEYQSTSTYIALPARRVQQGTSTGVE